MEVGPAHNGIRVEADAHSWVAIIGDGLELVRDFSGQPSAEFHIPPGAYEIRTDGRVRDTVTFHREPLSLPLPELLGTAADLRTLFEAPPTPVLHLDIDAPSRHPADGMPQLPADGTAFCTVTVRKTSPDGTLLKGRGHTDQVFLRTTGGTLLAADSDDRISSVRLRSGRARFRLVAEQAPRLVTMYAFTADAGLCAETQAEFI
ncbi:hypothetical protein ACGFY0_14295 [Streptomyces chartreusis]|uniref:hypothetical protein n=1 Tax=Streptomyces chartreusis TaxID=1969 RepID=UPI003719BB60